MIAIQPVMLAQIGYLRNAPNVKVASTYGKEHVNLHVLYLPTNMKINKKVKTLNKMKVLNKKVEALNKKKKVPYALKLALLHYVCKNNNACLLARRVLKNFVKMIRNIVD